MPTSRHFINAVISIRYCWSSIKQLPILKKVLVIIVASDTGRRMEDDNLLSTFFDSLIEVNIAMNGVESTAWMIIGGKD